MVQTGKVKSPSTQVSCVLPHSPNFSPGRNAGSELGWFPAKDSNPNKLMRFFWMGRIGIFSTCPKRNHVQNDRPRKTWKTSGAQTENMFLAWSRKTGNSGHKGPTENLRAETAKKNMKFLLARLKRMCAQKPSHGTPKNAGQQTGRMSFCVFGIGPPLKAYQLKPKNKHAPNRIL